MCGGVGGWLAFGGLLSETGHVCSLLTPTASRKMFFYSQKVHGFGGALIGIESEKNKQTYFFNENGRVAVASQRELLCAYAPWSLETSLGSLGMSHISGMFQALSPSVATGSYIGCLANFKPYCNETTAVADATDRFNCVFTLTLCTNVWCERDFTLPN